MAATAEEKIAMRAAASERAEQKVHGAAAAAEAREAADAAERRAEMMARFAENSQLGDREKATIAPPEKKTLKRRSLSTRRVCADVSDYESAAVLWAGGTSPGRAATSSAVSVRPTRKPADRSYQGRDEADGAAPAPHMWPASLKRWVERCFIGCRTSLERHAMQIRVKGLVDHAYHANTFDKKDWDREPVPSKDPKYDRKREQYGDNEYADRLRRVRDDEERRDRKERRRFY